MTIQEFFYITASIMAILASVLVIALIILAVRIERTIKSGVRRINLAAGSAADYFEGFAKTWGRLTISRIVIKTLRSVFGR
jgi:hypothetical protein